MNPTENEQEDINPFNNPLKVIQQGNNKIVDFYLFEEIKNVGQYIDFLREIHSATEKDIIQVHINCPGGVIDVAWNIYDELRGTEAQVKISIEGECASAASMILLAGDEWHINEHSYVMVHAWSCGMYGKRNELIAMSDFHKKYLESKFREMYKDFMSLEEIENCLNGKDYYFTAEEVLKRIVSFQKDEADIQNSIQKIQLKHQDALDKEIQKLLKQKSQKEKIFKPKENSIKELKVKEKENKRKTKEK